MNRITEISTMIRSVCLLLLLCLSPSFNAQTFVYANDRFYFTEMICNVSDGYILPQNSNMWSDASLTARNNKIFKGFSTSTFDILYTLEDGHLYAGDSNFSFDVLFTTKNGKVYKGEGTMMMDCLFTYDLRTNKLYKGDSTFPLDAVLHFQGDGLKTEELLALLIWLEFI